jgi:hypothetical protein
MSARGSKRAFAAPLVNDQVWHIADIHFAASEGPITSRLPTLGTEGIRQGLTGLTGLYGALVFWFLQAPLANRSHLKLHPETNLHESR